MPPSGSSSQELCPARFEFRIFPGGRCTYYHPVFSHLVAATFLDVCNAASYSVPPDALAMRAFLEDAKVAELSSLSIRRKLLEEHCATLIWARQSLGHCGPSCRLGRACLRSYRKNYSRCILFRLSRAPVLRPQTSPYLPTRSLFSPRPAASPSPALCLKRAGGASSAAGSQAQSGGINTARPDGGQAAPPPAASPSPPLPPALPVTIFLLNLGLQAPAAQSSGPPAKRQRLMSYEELDQALPPAGFLVHSTSTATWSPGKKQAPVCVQQKRSLRPVHGNT